MHTQRLFRLTAISLAVAGLTGCAQFGLVPLDARSVDVSPVYRGGDVPGTAAGQLALGRVDLAVGRIDAAIERFRNAILLDATNGEAYNSLGVAQGILGRFDEAVATFQEGLRHDPGSARLFNNLGYAQLRAGQTEASARSLGRALELDASSERTRANLKLLAEARTPAVAGNNVPAVSAVSAGQTPPATPGNAAAALQVIGESAAARSAAAYTIVAERAPAASLHQVLPGIYEYRVADSAGRIDVGHAAVASRPAASPPMASTPMAFKPVAPTTVASPVAMTTASQPPAALPAVAPSPRLPEPVKASVDASVAPSANAVSGIEVSNGVGIPGVAGLAAQQLSRVGVGVSRVSNNRSWTLRQTQVSYRAGHEQAAHALARTLPIEVRLVEVTDLAPGVNLRLVIGQNIATAPGVSFLRGKFATPGQQSPVLTSSPHVQPSTSRAAADHSGAGFQV